MFEISELKAKTLADLQVIAKSIGLTKISQTKKLDLVYQILDLQAANPTIPAKSESTVAPTKTEKPKRKRVSKPVKEETAVKSTDVIEEPVQQEKKEQPVRTRPKIAKKVRRNRVSGSPPIKGV